MRLSPQDVHRIWDGTHESYVDDPQPPPRMGWDWQKIGAWAVMLAFGGGALYFAAVVVAWAVRVVAR